LAYLQLLGVLSNSIKTFTYLAPVVH